MSLEHLSEVSQTLPVPENYREGVRLRRWLWIDNLVLFHRGHVQALKRRNYADRLHHRHVLICALKTAGVVCVDGWDIHLRSGQALLVFPYQLHFYKDLEEERLSWLYCTFEVRRGEGDLGILRQSPVILKEGTQSSLARLVEAWKQRDSLVRAEELVIWEMERVLESLVLQGEVRSSLSDDRNGEPKDRRVASVMRKIRESVGEPVSLEELARDVGMSERQLRNRFRRATGHSPQEYKNKLRYIHAFRLIRETDMHFTQIASQAGFSSLASFSHFIQKHSGYSPRALRQLMDTMATGPSL